MTENTISILGKKRALLARFQRFAEITVSVILAAIGQARELGRRTLNFTAAAVKTIRGTKLLLGDREYTRTLDCLRQFEVQALAIALHLGSPEKKIRACLDIGRTTSAFNRDTRAVLTAALEILKNREYWIVKQNRIFTVVQMACALARLAAKSGQSAVGGDIYLWAQQYNALVVDIDRRIALAVALSDVAAHLKAGCDQAAWLTTALELASGIRGEKLRLGAVTFVTRKMVSVGVPPPENAREDRRFVVVEEPTLETPPQPTVAELAAAAAAADDDIKFDVIAG